MIMNKRPIDIPLWLIKLIAVYEVIKMLPTILRLSYLQFLNPLLEARIRQLRKDRVG